MLHVANGELPSSFTAYAAVAVSVRFVARATSTATTAVTAALHRRPRPRSAAKGRWAAVIGKLCPMRGRRRRRAGEYGAYASTFPSVGMLENTTAPPSAGSRPTGSPSRVALANAFVTTLFVANMFVILRV